MFGFETLTCLNEIPGEFFLIDQSRKLCNSFRFFSVVRSSTDFVQNVYSKAKNTTVLIRFPCSVAETIADKSLKVALTVVSPFVHPFSRPGKRNTTKTKRFFFQRFSSFRSSRDR